MNERIKILIKFCSHSRLPSFTLEQKPLLKKLKMRSSGDSKSKRKSKNRVKKAPSPNPTASPDASSSSTTAAASTASSTSTTSPQPSAKSEPVSLESQPSLAVKEEDGVSISSFGSVSSPLTEKTFVGGDMLARSPVGSVQDLSVVR